MTLPRIDIADPQIETDEGEVAFYQGEPFTGEAQIGDIEAVGLIQSAVQQAP
jgi:hypothetical protein